MKAQMETRFPGQVKQSEPGGLNKVSTRVAVGLCPLPGTFQVHPVVAELDTAHQPRQDWNCQET